MLSRVADSLYWMSRYLERAEHTARLIDVQLNLTLDQSPISSTNQRWKNLFESRHLDMPDGDDYELTRALTFDADNAASIIGCITASRENARQIREQISSEMWLQLNRLYLDVQHTHMDNVWNSQPHLFFRAIREGSHLFQGITDGTMNHGEGWQFIQLGRFIERALSLIRLVDIHYGSFPPARDYQLSMVEYFEWLGFLKFFTAFEAYCKVYNADLRSNWIAEFLLLNAEFPHSLRFCVEQVNTALNTIAEATESHKNSRVHRLTGRLRSMLSFDEIGEILTDLHGYLGDINDQCAQIHDSMYETYIYRPISASLD